MPWDRVRKVAVLALIALGLLVAGGAFLALATQDGDEAGGPPSLPMFVLAGACFVAAVVVPLLLSRVRWKID